MKKLIIAACAVAFATVSQAAALNWSTWGYTGDNPDEGLLDGSNAYLVMVTDTSSFAVADDLSVTGGTIVDSSSFAEGVVAGVWNGTSDLVDGTTYYFAIIGTTAGTGSSVPTEGLYGVDDNGGSLYAVTWNASTGGGLAPDWDTYGGLSSNTAVATPEPTSGLLLLLGVAGLALKRKCA